MSDEAPIDGGEPEPGSGAAAPTAATDAETPVIEYTLVPALKMMLLRGVVGTLLSVGLTMVIVLGRFGATWSDAGFALKIGLPIGLLLLSPTVVAEAWGQRGKRSPWAVAGLAFVLVLLGWVVGFLQAIYAIELGLSGDPAAAFAHTLALVPNLLDEPVFLVVAVIWPLPVAGGLLLKLGRLRYRLGWAVAAAATLALASYGLGNVGGSAQLRVWFMIPFVAVGITLLLWALYAALDVVYGQIWEGSDAGNDEPPPPLTACEWILYGGPSGTLALVVWFGLALGFGLATSSWWVAGTFLVGFSFHAILSGNLPRILLAQRRPERAIAVALRQLSDSIKALERNRRHSLVAMIRAHLFLRQVEAADARLPETLALFEDTTQTDQVFRLQLALAYLQAGVPERALELAEAIPEAEWRRLLRNNRTLLISVALGHLGRVEEALALLDTIDLPRAPRAIRSLVLNNRAVYTIQTEGDPSEALRLATEARELARKPQLVAVRPTLGAAILYSGGDATEALGLLETADLDDPPFSPHAKAWVLLQRGRAHAALGDPEAAEREYTAAAALPGPSADAARGLLSDGASKG